MTQLRPINICEDDLVSARKGEKYEKILITGTVMTADGNSVKIYEDLVNICKKVSDNIYSPLDTMQFKGNDTERYNRAMELLKETDIIVAEMSVPSTGQGMELQEAVRLDISIIVIAKSGSKVSGLIKGSGKVKSILYYNNIEDIEKELIKQIEEENNERTNC